MKELEGANSGEDLMETSEPSFCINDFPVIDGEHCCPRCNCCTVGVGPHHEKTIKLGDEVITASIYPSTADLRREPSVDPSAEPEAWYCRGGCDNQGNHSRTYSSGTPSFIGRVTKPERVGT